MWVDDVTATLDLALSASGLDHVTVAHLPRLLSDNASSYVAGDVAKWLEDNGMEHVTRGAVSSPDSGKDRALATAFYLSRLSPRPCQNLLFFFLAATVKLGVTAEAEFLRLFDVANKEHEDRHPRGGEPKKMIPAGFPARSRSKFATIGRSVLKPENRLLK